MKQSSKVNNNNKPKSSGRSNSNLEIKDSNKSNKNCVGDKENVNSKLDNNSTFRILIASDNHLGYLENDQIRGDDSFNTFEEILQRAKNENVDFLLLGGDLFHQHNPSKKTIIRTGKILQEYVYGQKKYNYEVLCYNPNFKNENLSVEVPIFIIHGNHDDPSGFENFSSIDIFAGKELNYFGKINNYEKFDLTPILFIKGKTKIALYGIGYIKDERLYLALQNKKVIFHRPEDYKNWFNILVVHQTRFRGHNIGKNKKSYLPESFIPSFFDLVIWGHEHECFTEAINNDENGFHIYQPGSSVATSLIQAEAKPKHIGLCEINQDKFRIIPIKLESQRPFIYDQFELKQFADDIDANNSSPDIEKIIEKKVADALDQAEKVRTNKLKPIVRLKIEYTGYSIIKMNSIISKYSKQVANPSDMLQFWKKADVFQVKRGELNDGLELSGGNVVDQENSLLQEMDDLDEELKNFINVEMNNFFVDKKHIPILNPSIFGEFLDMCVNGNERHSLESLFTKFYQISDKHRILDDIKRFESINPLEKTKPDFSLIINDFINKEAINQELNNMKDFGSLEQGKINLNNKKLKYQNGLDLLDEEIKIDRKKNGDFMDVEEDDYNDNYINLSSSGTGSLRGALRGRRNTAENKRRVNGNLGKKRENSVRSGSSLEGL